jgi:hypothetical protein
MLGRETRTGVPVEMAGAVNRTPVLGWFSLKVDNTAHCKACPGSLYGERARERERERE